MEVEAQNQQTSLPGLFGLGDSEMGPQSQDLSDSSMNPLSPRTNLEFLDSAWKFGTSSAPDFGQLLETNS